MFESKGKMKRKVKSFIILLVSMSLSFVACLLILGFGENKNTNVDKHNPTQILYIPVSVNQHKGMKPWLIATISVVAVICCGIVIYSEITPEKYTGRIGRYPIVMELVSDY